MTRAIDMQDRSTDALHIRRTFVSSSIPIPPGMSTDIHGAVGGPFFFLVHSPNCLFGPNIRARPPCSVPTDP